MSKNTKPSNTVDSISGFEFIGFWVYLAASFVSDFVLRISDFDRDCLAAWRDHLFKLVLFNNSMVKI